jgi:leucine dehydrogenase
MKLFDYMGQHNHEVVVFRADRIAGLKAIVAIHNTTLGPALGGVRMWPYRSEEEALVDVLRLSECMTYKASVAGLNLGGGKAVIIGDPATDKSKALFRAFGKFVDSLHGKYITAEDVGTTVSDMTYVRLETPYVVGLPTSERGSGDPSPMTAFGVYRGMKACCQARFGSDTLTGRISARPPEAQAPSTPVQGLPLRPGTTKGKKPGRLPCLRSLAAMKLPITPSSKSGFSS